MDYRSDPNIAVIQGEVIGHLITEFFNRIGHERTLDALVLGRILVVPKIVGAGEKEYRGLWYTRNTYILISKHQFIPWIQNREEYNAVATKIS